jgi:hypothetical protein
LVNPTQSIREAKINFGRTISERNDLVNLFGRDVIEMYRVPFYPRIKALIIIFFKNPFYTMAAVVYNIWVIFSQTDDPGRSNGLWSIIKTSKGPIRTR